ncbi:putative eka-like protein [Golovinomyces cichoracearum]|uniref:Putative eka-like protein n=1 Tax=Golovinomyces cichoracearum TaxID=62708 RepID=A0A420H8D9_9PEZI|nr:putative eka-like protein [Golovinomyces cichoracearum]
MASIKVLLSASITYQYPSRQYLDIALIYADIVAAAAKTLGKLLWFENKICQKFTAEDLEVIEKVLGIPITQDKKKKPLLLDQWQYLEKIPNQL